MRLFHYSVGNIVILDKNKNMGKFDVFVCFNGENMTRDQSFGQGLFDALKEAHISAVVDEKPKQGKFLRKAMKKKTTIFVVVFSPKFTSCSVCLNELVQIVKERKDGQIIVPVFYEVDPSDVRKQRGDYQIKSDGVEAIQALKTVSSIKGLESRQFKYVYNIFICISKFTL